jgi:hypothetical protein
MFDFFKRNIGYITDHAVDPDKLRLIDTSEAPRHFIDMEYYLLQPLDSVPRHWKPAVEKFSKDTLNKYGINPWYVQTMYYRLVNAFKEKDSALILRYSARLGHYVADACVPLHTSWNYNGQLTGQTGIHAFWETSVPELLGEDFDLFTGKAEYIERPDSLAWALVSQSHAEVDSILRFEKQLSSQWSDDEKYALKPVNGKLMRSYSDDYINAYNQLLDNMAEKRMRAAIQAVGSIWFSAWVDAGQPGLKDFRPAEVQKEKEPDPDSLLNLNWIGRPE